MKGPLPNDTRGLVIYFLTGLLLRLVPIYVFGTFAVFLSGVTSPSGVILVISCVAAVSIVMGDVYLLKLSKME